MKKIGYTGIVFALALLFSQPANAQEQKVAKMRKPAKQAQIVVFVCEHGSAKSVVAAAHFNKLARERKLNLRAISRGTNPDKELPEGTLKGLKADGLKVDGTKPKKLSKTDVARATRVVAFCQIPEAYATATRVEQWENIPPMSEDYNKFRDIIVEHIKHLLEELKSAK